MLKHPHDRLFKRVFSDPLVAAGHFQAALPEALALAFDWDRLRAWEGPLVAAHRLHGDAATEPLFRYMMYICPEGPDPAVSRWIGDRLGQQEVQMVKSWAQKLREEGREEGRGEGREEGVGIGLTQGARQKLEALVLRLLAGRFGALPGDAEARVASASDEALERVVDDIFRAPALDALLPR